MCRRLARSGYVVASADYRLGWNPITPDPRDLTIGLINAAYRGVQDANTCIRFFKKTVAKDDNPFRIDTCRIVLFGDDTGGYLSVNAGALDRYSKIPETEKFTFTEGGNIYPMVVEPLSGDVEGKTYGVNTPPVSYFLFPPGDTLSYPNHIEYSSSFAASVSLSGAVGDTSWIDPGQPPVIAFHVPSDYTTPYGCETVFIQFGDQLIPVIHVCGSQAVTYKKSLLGDNLPLTPLFYSDEFQMIVTDVANGRTGGIEGLMPLFGDAPADFNPWNYWDCPTNPNCERGLEDNPNMSYAKADMYIDTILAYVLPRLYQTLHLDSKSGPECMILNTGDFINNDITVELFPNPSSDRITVTTSSDYVLRKLGVFDMKGMQVYAVSGIDDKSCNIDTERLVSGIYLIRLQFDEGTATQRFVVK
jgi:hypothetical protein